MGREAIFALTPAGQEILDCRTGRCLVSGWSIERIDGGLTASCMPRKGWATTRSPPGSAPPARWFSKWRKRFCEQRLAGLADLPRGGRPAAFLP